MKTSANGRRLIREFEGCKLVAYKCPANVWTIGVGHTGNVKRGDRITDVEAENLLIQDLERFERAVLKLVKVPINQNQFDALVSFAFNVGEGALARSSLLKKLNAKDYAGAADEFLKWNRGGGRVLPGLVRRREAERKLFLLPATDLIAVEGLEALKDLAFAGTVDLPTSDRPSIKTLQQLLTRAGYPCGGIDGLWGRKTEAAFKAFKVKNHLSEHQKLGQASLDRLIQEAGL